jgi:hypothetical protein
MEKRIDALINMPDVDRMPVLRLDNENLRERIRQLGLKSEAADILEESNPQLREEWKAALGTAKARRRERDIRI